MALKRLQIATLVAPLMWLVAHAPAAEEVAFVKEGKALLVRERGGRWKIGKECIQGSGLKTYLFAAKASRGEDLHVKSKIAIVRLRTTSASFVINGRFHFGFDVGRRRLFVSGGLAGKDRTISKPLKFFKEGKPFEFEVIQKGSDLKFLIKGNEVFHIKEWKARIVTFGFRPWRAGMRVYEFSAKGVFSDVYDLEPSLEKHHTLPVIDLSNDEPRQIVIARATEDAFYGCPTTVLMGDGKTLFAAWTAEPGRRCGPLARSTDGGLSWSPPLLIPDAWKTVRYPPAIRRITDSDGKERLFVFAGDGDMHQAYSHDKGHSWTPLRKNGLKCSAPPTTVLAIQAPEKDDEPTPPKDAGEPDKKDEKPPAAKKDKNKRTRHLMWYHYDGLCWQAASDDGGLTWGDATPMCDIIDSSPADPCVVRSPDGKQLLCLMRDAARRCNAVWTVSDDDGATWAAPRELPAALAGDRHVIRYAPDGRLVCVFRDTATSSPTKGHFCAWVGKYDDILFGREGQYRLKLLHSFAGNDSDSAGLECLADGTFVATTYVCYRPGGERESIVSVRFKLDELDAKAKLLPAQTDLFAGGKGGYHAYRIPAVVATKNNSLLAFCEGRRFSVSDTGDIDLLVRRSTDAGKTWSKHQVLWSDRMNTCGSPCPVVDRDTGTVWLLMSWNRGDDFEHKIIAGTAKDTRRVFVTHSTDDGLTWAKPTDITKATKKPEWSWCTTGPGVGVQLRHGPQKGRLVIPCDHRFTGDDVASRAHVIFSDDHGKTWKIGGSSADGARECQLVERTDGSLLLNMRPAKKTEDACRLVATSKDGGASWSKSAPDKALLDPHCQATIIRLKPSDSSDKTVLFANPANRSQSIGLAVRLSDDDGKTWAASQILFAGPSAYSCLAPLPDGAIGCLYERGKKHPYQALAFARFQLEWLLDAKPKSRGEPPAKAEARATSPAR